MTKSLETASDCIYHLRIINIIAAIEILIGGRPSEVTEYLLNEFNKGNNNLKGDLDKQWNSVLRDYMRTYVNTKCYCVNMQETLQKIITDKGDLIPTELKDINYTDLDTCIQIFEEAEYLQKKLTDIDIYLLQVEGFEFCRKHLKEVPIVEEVSKGSKIINIFKPKKDT